MRLSTVAIAFGILAFAYPSSVVASPMSPLPHWLTSFDNGSTLAGSTSSFSQVSPNSISSRVAMSAETILVRSSELESLGTTGTSNGQADPPWHHHHHHRRPPPHHHPQPQVPESGTLLLLGTGLPGIAWMRKLRLRFL